MEFKVGDLVSCRLDGKFYNGLVVAVKKEYLSCPYLCYFYGFNGHNGLYHGYIQDNKHNYWCHNDMLKLTKEKDDKENDIKGEQNMEVVSKGLNDIRVEEVVKVIPQKNAAPLKVTCKQVVMDINGTECRATCMPEDEFDLERGLEICLLKYTCANNYSKVMKTIVNKYKEFESKREETKRIEEKKVKLAAKKEARKARKEEEARQSRINEMAEAFLLSMKRYDGLMDNNIDSDSTYAVPMDTEKMCTDYLKTKGIFTASDDK